MHHTITAVMTATLLFAWAGRAEAQALTAEEYYKQGCTNRPEACELGNKLAKRMLACLRRPTNLMAEPQDYKMLARVMLKDGEIDFVSIAPNRYPTEWEKQIVPSLADALYDCGPYDRQSGPALFFITPGLLQSALHPVTSTP